MENIKKITKWIILSTLLYLTIFTWNAKTGFLDKISTNIGLNISGMIFYPGEVAIKKIQTLWNQYIYLVNVQKENKRLKEEIDKLKLKITWLEIKSKEWERIRRLLNFNPIPNWDFIGARVVYHQLGPTNLLNSIVIDCGAANGVKKNMPVITPDGLVGRISKVSTWFSQVLLISDENSKIPVISQKHRTLGILEGKGIPNLMEVKFVQSTASLEVGEVLITSGLGGIFPKGIPVGEIKKIEYNKSSLFKRVFVAPFVDVTTIEEVLILTPTLHNLSTVISK